MGSKNGKLTLGFPKGSVFFKIVSNAENVSNCEQLASRFLNQKISFCVTEMESKTDTKSIVEKAESERESIKKKTLASPWVQKAQKIFEGKVVDITIEEEKGDTK